MKGNTLIELIVVLGIFALLISITGLNLMRFQHQANITGLVDSFITNVKEQQTKAMSGDTEGRGTNSSYGINMASTYYVQYHNIYSSTDPSNFKITLPPTVQIATTFPNSQLVFEGGTGEIVGYSSSAATVTFHDTTTNDQRVVTFNKLGVIVSVH